MAEGERNKTTTSQRRPYQQRPNHSNRGRGRPDPHVSKALHFFGVPDLREWLDKKHEQEGQPKAGGPPPDPSFNYLKDPLRENANYEYQTRKHHKEYPERGADSWSRGHSSRGSRGRGAGTHRDDRYSKPEKTSFIQNPVNIKVELSTATGERSYKLDEETKLADIKHIPDRKQEWRPFRQEKSKLGEETKPADKQFPGGRQERRSFRDERAKPNEEAKWTEFQRFPERQQERASRGERGRNVYGRGGGRGARDEGSRDNGDHGRGRWRRGRGGRGSGHSRGQGKYNPNIDKKQLDTNLPQNVTTTEVPTEEDWDNECIGPALSRNDECGNVESREEEQRENQNVEETDLQYQEEYYEEVPDLPEDYEEGDEEYLAACEEGYNEAYLELNEESESSGIESEIVRKLEENLVISSVVDQNEENGKRTVRFKLENKEDDKKEDTDSVCENQIKSDELQREEAVPDDKTTKDEDVAKSKAVEEKNLPNLDKPLNAENKKESTEEATTENIHGDKKE